MYDGVMSKRTGRPPGDPWSLVHVDDAECWLWCGYLDKAGYGRWGRKLAHRVIWELDKGPILEGLVYRHGSCSRRCVNPDHAREPGTQAQNNRDAVADGTHVSHHRGKTHCKRGHEYLPETTRVHPVTGHRACKTCIRDAQRSRRGTVA